LLGDIDRGDSVPELDGFYKWWWHPYLKLLFSQYDVVQCYATYTAIPFIIQNDYIAYEHGTIRSIPFQETNEGRMCASSYRGAHDVFVTNIDNIEAARRLKIARDRTTFLPHAFDDQKLVRFGATADVANPLSKRVTFLTPARQHWVDNDPGWAKGNDRVFAALRRVKDSGRTCVLRAVAWGNDLAASRARIAELGIEDMIEWLPEMKKRELWQEYLGSDAVIDQFVVPAFGGITFEALSLAKRVITYVDLKTASEFFGEAPPVLPCFTTDEIAEAMLRIIDDPSDLARIGEASRKWTQRYHSADRIVAIQTEVYRSIIDGQRVAPRPDGGPNDITQDIEMTMLDQTKSEICAWLTGGESVESTNDAFVAKAYDWERTTQGNLIVMLVVSALRIDPRVEREARALAGRGWQVRIVSPDISDPPHSRLPLDWGPNVDFQLLPLSAAQYVMQPPWLLGDEMYEAAISNKPFAYHCHDLNTALVGLRAARHVGARWVCDFHEWASENVTWDTEKAMWVPHAPPHRLLLRWAEALAIRLADDVITVNESIARELEKLGCGRSGGVKVVRNIPPLATQPTHPYPPLKEQFGIPSERFVVLYQGGTGPTRLLEPVIEALSFAPKAVLVIRGPSLDLFGEGYRETARRFGVEERLILADPVPSRDVIAAGRGADAGLWTLPNLSKNFYYALPNKIFEYLASGSPLLVANFPEPTHVVESQQVGLAFDPYDTKSIASQINRLIDEPGLADRFRAAVPGALSAMNADMELVRFADIYDELRANGSPRTTTRPRTTEVSVK
jgi:glycosyltransferase involved in cell wall biosynthesis